MKVATLDPLKMPQKNDSNNSLDNVFHRFDSQNSLDYLNKTQMDRSKKIKGSTSIFRASLNDRHLAKESAYPDADLWRISSQNIANRAKNSNLESSFENSLMRRQIVFDGYKLSNSTVPGLPPYQYRQERTIPHALNSKKPLRHMIGPPMKEVTQVSDSSKDGKNHGSGFKIFTSRKLTFVRSLPNDPLKDETGFSNNYARKDIPSRREIITPAKGASKYRKPSGDLTLGKYPNQPSCNSNTKIAIQSNRYSGVPSLVRNKVTKVNYNTPLMNIHDNDHRSINGSSRKFSTDIKLKPNKKNTKELITQVHNSYTFRVSFKKDANKKT